jgi:hypothetical protein
MLQLVKSIPSKFFYNVDASETQWMNNKYAKNKKASANAAPKETKSKKAKFETADSDEEAVMGIGGESSIRMPMPVFNPDENKISLGTLVFSGVIVPSCPYLTVALRPDSELQRGVVQ